MNINEAEVFLTARIAADEAKARAEGIRFRPRTHYTTCKTALEFLERSIHGAKPVWFDKTYSSQWMVLDPTVYDAMVVQGGEQRVRHLMIMAYRQVSGKSFEEAPEKVT